MNKIVCNSSPIIGLCIIERLDLLCQLFDEVIIPQEVYNEIVVSEERLGAKELKKAIEDGNIRIHNVKNQKLVRELHGRLHKGELEVIVAARELKLKYVIIDDRSARYFADSMMLKTLGLMGILLLAKKHHKIGSVGKYLDLLIEKGYRVSVKLYNMVLQQANEQ